MGCLDGALKFYHANGQQRSKDRNLGFDPLSIAHFSNGEYLAISGTDKWVGYMLTCALASVSLCECERKPRHLCMSMRTCACSIVRAVLSRMQHLWTRPCWQLCNTEQRHVSRVACCLLSCARAHSLVLPLLLITLRLCPRRVLPMLLAVPPLRPRYVLHPLLQVRAAVHAGRHIPHSDRSARQLGLVCAAAPAQQLRSAGV